MWIRIEMASLNPDQYRENGLRIQVQGSQSEVQKGIVQRFHVEKSLTILLNPDGFHLSLEVLNQGLFGNFK